MKKNMTLAGFSQTGSHICSYLHKDKILPAGTRHLFDIRLTLDTDVAFWLKMKIGLTSLFYVNLTLDFGCTT